MTKSLIPADPPAKPDPYSAPYSTMLFTLGSIIAYLKANRGLASADELEVLRKAHKVLGQLRSHLSPAQPMRGRNV